jgi:hypothetical protein
MGLCYVEFSLFTENQKVVSQSRQSARLILQPSELGPPHPLASV